MENNKMRTAIAVAISLALIFLGVAFLNSKTVEYKKLSTELKEKEDLAKKRLGENAITQARIEKNAGELNIYQLEQDSTQLFNALFYYNSWNDYYNNSIGLQKFPLLHQNTLIDTTGSNSGSGESPKSSYEITNKFISNQDESEVFLIKQTIINGTKTFIKEYYIKTTGSGESFNVAEFKVLKELTKF